MAKAPDNHRSPWTANDARTLSKLADGNTPTRIIALKMERTEAAVRSKASDLDISLKPANQSPYGTKR